jgi:type I restriction enzyme S subunit
MPKIDLNPHDWDEVSRILRIHIPGYEVWAFGSRVTWSAKQYSDLDLAVITKHPLPLSISADLKNAFAESSLSIKVDVVDWATTAESFRRIIEKGKVIVQVPQPGLVNWIFKKLIDCTRDGNLSYGIVQPGQHDEKGIPIVRVNNVNNGQLRLDDVMRVSPEIEAKYKRTRLEGGEVLLTLVGSTGQSLVVPNELAGWNIARAIAVIRPRPEIGANWINICLQSKAVQQFLDERANTTVQKTLNLGDVKELPIPIPPREAKDAIESVAMVLANKIELNRRMNETLEAIARAMFKSWFVDFDPVRAKMNGEPTVSICQRLGLTPDLLALFPDRLVDSELGEIPEGWNVESVYKIASVIYGAPFASSKFNTDGIGIPLIRIRDLKDESPGVHTEESHPKGYMVRAGDIVVGMDGEFRAYLWGGEDAWLNQRVCVFKPIEGYSAPFIHNSIAPCLAHIEETETATTVIHLGKNDIDRFIVVNPAKNILTEFNALSCPLYERIVINKKELRVLASIRDALLPKLLSGELRVPDAEKTVELMA